MAQAISVRLDDDAERALRLLQQTRKLSFGGDSVEALIDAANRQRRSSELAAESAALEADEKDRREMLAVAEMMDSLRAPR